MKKTTMFAHIVVSPSPIPGMSSGKALLTFDPSTPQLIEAVKESISHTPGSSVVGCTDNSVKIEGTFPSTTFEEMKKMVVEGRTLEGVKVEINIAGTEVTVRVEFPMTPEQFALHIAGKSLL